MMYSPRNLLSKSPIVVAGAVVAVVNWLIIAGWWWSWDGKTVSGFNIALVSLLGLFVSSTTTNTAELHEWHEAISGGVDDVEPTGTVDVDVSQANDDGLSIPVEEDEPEDEPLPTSARPKRGKRQRLPK